MNPKAKPVKSTILVTRISDRLLPPINAISGVLSYKYCVLTFIICIVTFLVTLYFDNPL